MKNKEQIELICPDHKVKLVLREAKTGINRGTKFWGCPTYFRTGCTYTQPIKKKKRFEKETIWLKYKNDFKNAALGRRVLLMIKFILIVPFYILGFGAAAVFGAYRAKYKL